MESAGFESLRQLARKSGVSVQQISSWSRGTVRPSPDSLEQIAPHLRLPLATLLVWAGWVQRKDLRVVEGVEDLPVALQQLIELWQTGDRGDRREVLDHTQIILRAVLDLREARQRAAIDTPSEGEGTG